MLKEIAHFARALPETRRMFKTMSKDAFLDAVTQNTDEAGKLKWRASLVADLEGDVLEIGCGTGRSPVVRLFSGGGCGSTAAGATSRFTALASRSIAPFPSVPRGEAGTAVHEPSTCPDGASPTGPARETCRCTAGDATRLASSLRFAVEAGSVQVEAGFAIVLPRSRRLERCCASLIRANCSPPEQSAPGGRARRDAWAVDRVEGGRRGAKE